MGPILMSGGTTAFQHGGVSLAKDELKCNGQAATPSPFDSYLPQWARSAFQIEYNESRVAGTSHKRSDIPHQQVNEE